MDQDRLHTLEVGVRNFVAGMKITAPLEEVMAALAHVLQSELCMPNNGIEVSIPLDYLMRAVYGTLVNANGPGRARYIIGNINAGRDQLARIIGE